ncbi:MAG: ferredoxin reductase family protein [Actinomycetota bacterium]|nr:ferredoxin reductase family protein [Actinomycetota bacterium]
MRAEQVVRPPAPLALIVLIVAPAVLWAQTTPWNQWCADAASALSGIGVALGLVGVAAFALNIVLGARLHTVERAFGGLEALYRAHRVNGRVAYLLILGHVILILAARFAVSPETALRLLTPAAGVVVLLGLIAFVAMTAAIAATLYARLTHETFVYVQRSFGVIFAVAAAHVFLTAGAKSSSSALTLYLATLSIVAMSAFTYRSVLGNLLVRRYDYTVTDVRQFDRSVVEITMEPVDRHLQARPGQFVFVTFYSDAFNAQFHPVSLTTAGPSATLVLRPGDARNQFHPFSLTSTHRDPYLKLVVKAVGQFTHALHKLRPGAIARVEGPYGEFSYLNIRSRRQIWIAGGIGITPFLSMARALEGDDYEVDLYWGVNDRRQAYFAEELADIESRVSGFRVLIVPEDERGFITPALIAERSGVEGADILIVGPPAMERALRQQLEEAGVPPRRIHSERFAFGPRR